MKFEIGTKNGKKVMASYKKVGADMPTLAIGPRKWRGSSISQANPGYPPNESDIKFWQTLARDAGLID